MNNGTSTTSSRPTEPQPSPTPPTPQPGETGSPLKRLLFRAMRPGLRDVNAKLDQLCANWSDATRELMGAGLWRGQLVDGAAMGPDIPVVRSLSDKYRQELAFWVQWVREECVRATGADFNTTYGRWQRERIAELGHFLGLAGEAELHAWTRTKTAIELGPGPFPSICVAPWRRAVAVDPIADGYTAERLLPPEAESVVFIAGTGENVPLASGVADIVVIENALDHVDDPRRVLLEIRRLLRPDGLVWVLVDLMNYRDHLHPNPFSEQTIRQLLIETGYAVVRDRVSDHKSHPEAYGEYRGLLRRSGSQRPEIVTRVGAMAHA